MNQHISIPLECPCGRHACRERHYSVGSILAHPQLGNLQVLRIFAFGTYDVRASDGRQYRVTGLTRYKGETDND